LKLETREHRLRLLLFDCGQIRRVLEINRQTQAVENKLQRQKSTKRDVHTIDRAAILQLGERPRSGNIDMEWDLDEEPAHKSGPNSVAREGEYRSQETIVLFKLTTNTRNRRGRKGTDRFAQKFQLRVCPLREE